MTRQPWRLVGRSESTGEGTIRAQDSALGSCPEANPLASGATSEAPSEPTQEHGQDGTRRETGATVAHVGRRILRGLELVARLHAELAQTYENLEGDVGIALADSANLSLTQCVPMVPTSKMPLERRTAEDAGLISQEALARLLQCHPRTVRRMELEGRIPAPKGEGRLKRWRRADIEQWLDGRPPSRRRGTR